MEELQVPTRRIHVEVFVTTGARVAVALFVHAAPYETGDAEDVLHVLNDKRAFLPLAMDGNAGEAFVINKDHILHVRLPWNGAPSFECVRDRAPDDGAESTMLLSDGTCLKGTLALDTPTSASRIVDKLNQASSFVPFVTADGIDFVQKSHVVHAS